MTSTEDLQLERFSAGEQFAVNPDAIERELAALWRTAGKSTDAGQPVTRACLWNVVVHVEERTGREGSGFAEEAIETINEMPRHLAARALVLRTRDAGSASPKLESWISANCILSGDGGKLVCSEEITLASHGDGDRLLPSLVRALLVPAVPTAVVFDGVPKDGDPMTDALVHLADRIVVDVDRSSSSAPLTRARRLVDAAPGSAIDLGWLAERRLRQEIAALFDPPRTDEALRAVERVQVMAPTSRQWSARLLLGWIGGALRRAPGGAGSNVALVHDEDDAREGTTVTFEGANETVQLRVCNRVTGTIDITDELGSSRQPREETPRAALLARALTSRGQDHAFTRALDVAETLS